MAAQAKSKQGVPVIGNIQLNQRKIVKFAKDGWMCTCMTCEEVVKGMHEQGHGLKQKMSHLSQNVFDQVIAGNKNATVETNVGDSSCGEKHGLVCSQSVLRSYFKCKDCGNSVQCQYSEFSEEPCTTLDALLFPLCGSMLLPRENLRRQASCDGFSPDEHAAMLWVYYQLASVLTETIVR